MRKAEILRKIESGEKVVINHYSSPMRFPVFHVNNDFTRRDVVESILKKFELTGSFTKKNLSTAKYSTEVEYTFN